jgi:mono/diheme cytochrome c family protein
VPDPGGDTPIVNVPPVETCADNQFLAGCGGDVNNVPDDAPPSDTPDTPAAEPPATGSAADLAKAAAENVLLTECGTCHGTNLSADTARAGMNYINDIDRLVEEGKIKPGDAENSLIIQRMRAGTMPPANEGFAPVADANIEIVAQYINNPQFFDIEQDDCSDSNQEFTFDDLFEAVRDDLAGEDADDQVNFRYVALTNRFTAGVCADTAMDRDRQALNKLVNALSTETSLQEPLAINADRTIYRIDLRDYNWDRAIDVADGAGGVQNFNDVWEAIAANNAYAVQFEGDDADQAIEDSGTNFPVMFADSMLDAASIGNLYYAIIDVDVNQNIDDFISLDLGIDVVANLEDGDQVRAGTTKSRISRQDRLVQRDEIEVRGGVLWQSFDFADDQNESIFEEPFDFNEGGREAIFTLPNGMLGYIIADDAGAIVEDSDILLDTSQNNFRAVTSVSCSGCHSTGFIPVVDEVRELSLDNAIALEFNRDEVEQLEELYPEPTEFAQIVAQDSSDFYQRALDNLKLPTRGGDPISGYFLQFDRDMRLNDAAGDLGLSPEALQENLRELDPALQVLDRGVIDRDDFTQFYVNSLCLLSTPLENQPAVAVCDAAQALVDAL